MKLSQIKEYHFIPFIQDESGSLSSGDSEIGVDEDDDDLLDDDEIGNDNEDDGGESQGSLNDSDNDF